MRIFTSAALALSVALAAVSFSAPAQADRRDGARHHHHHDGGHRKHRRRGGISIGIGDGLFIGVNKKRRHHRRHRHHHHHH